jgi:hypothetical protein
VWEISTPEPTPSVLVTVGLHPDERGSVVDAIVHLVRALLLRGRVVVAHCFPDAPPERCIGPEKRDANRSFLPELLLEGSDPFRDRLRVLAELVTGVDYLIDLHRYTKADGGPVAFPYDGRGVDLALASHVPMIVTDVVSSVEGALSHYAAKRGVLPLVIEVGPREHARASDRNALSSLLGVLRALRMVGESDTLEPATAWPEGPKVFRLIRGIPKAQVSDDLRDALASLAHMAPLPPLLAHSLDLPADARLLMVNPEADPAAYACVPVFGG